MSWLWGPLVGYVQRVSSARICSITKAKSLPDTKVIGPQDPSIELSNSQPSHLIYEKEAKIKINYSGLEEKLIDMTDNDEVKTVEKGLEKQINELQVAISRIKICRDGKLVTVFTRTCFWG